MVWYHNVHVYLFRNCAIENQEKSSLKLRSSTNSITPELSNDYDTSDSISGINSSILTFCIMASLESESENSGRVSYETNDSINGK